MLSGCGCAPEARHAANEDDGPLRAVYRSEEGTMVLVLPEKGRAVPRGDCGAPLFIDARSGAVRVLMREEVQARLRTMQLAGATRGACPRT